MIGAAGVDNTDIFDEKRDDVRTIVVPPGVTEIGRTAFTYCSNLTSVTLPDTLTTIDEFAFDQCKGLTSLTLPDALTSVGRYAFKECTSLTSLTLPDTLTYIGIYAFAECSGLTSLTLPHALVTVGHHAFEYCTRLTSVAFRPPADAVFIAWSVKQLTSVNLPSDVVRAITALAWERRRSAHSVDPRGRNKVFRECSKLIFDDSDEDDYENYECNDSEEGGYDDPRW